MDNPTPYDIAQLTDDVKKLLGLAPYNTSSNICRNDAIYFGSLVKKYGETVVTNEMIRLGSSSRG